MKQFEIENIKKVTSELFAGSGFDEFQVVELSIDSLFSMHIDGHINKEFLTEEELEKSTDTAVRWKTVKHLCYEMLKGTRLPLKFDIVLMMTKTAEEKLAQAAGIGEEANNINGLFLNFMFKDKKLRCTSGVSLNKFTLDRSIEKAWDAMAASIISRIDG